MCIIVELKSGVVIPKTALENAVYNNPHGYGLIVIKGKYPNARLEVIKAIPEGGTNPNEVQELLDKHKSAHSRFLHLRWKTEGDISDENIHPFLVYDDGDKKVWFMHNGTMHDYKPAGEDKRSDSLIFATDILKPLLEIYKGDYLDLFCKKVISKFWVYGNRGLILSSHLAPLYLNFADWKDIKAKEEDGTEVEFKASNDTYFDKLTRGYEFERREEVRKREEAKTPFHSTSGTVDWPVVQLKDVDLSMNQFIDLKNLFFDADLYSEEGTAALANLTAAELMNLQAKDPEGLLSLVVHVTGMYSTLLNTKEELKDKLDRASKMIATLKPETPPKLLLLEGRVG